MTATPLKDGKSIIIIMIRNITARRFFRQDSKTKTVDDRQYIIWAIYWPRAAFKVLTVGATAVGVVSGRLVVL